MEPANTPSRRAPVTLKIKFKSGSVDEFVQRYAGDISHGGIFIRTKTPLTVGTTLRFEFQLRDATSLMGGDGTVVWIRESDPNRPTAVSGMGVRFDRLNDGSQLVLDRVLAHKGRPSQVMSSPPVSFDDATKENTAQTQPHAVGRYAATVADEVDHADDDRTIQRAAAPTGQHDAIDDFSDEPAQSTKVRPVSEIQRQLADSDIGRAAAASELLSQPTRPGIGMVGERTDALTVSDLMDASFDERGAEEPTVAMAAPMFPGGASSSSTHSDVHTVAVQRPSTASILAAQPVGSSAAMPKRRGGLYAAIAVGVVAAAAAFVLLVLPGLRTADEPAVPEQETISAAPTPAPIEPTPAPTQVEPPSSRQRLSRQSSAPVRPVRKSRLLLLRPRSAPTLAAPHPLPFRRHAT
ncbi:MAG: TIGR02266 family protein [Myxococcales bacterium]|nr:TIGR02266 family protein [Myxococcales bacterium]